MKVLKHSDKSNCMNINTFLQLIILVHTTVYALLLYDPDCWLSWIGISRILYISSTQLRENKGDMV